MAKDWIKKAVNPKHKGYCTPMTKATCTPRRKAFAKTMKKHHGFHKKEDGGVIGPEPEVNPAMTAMMRSKMALASEFGNPSARRMTSPAPPTYTFNGTEKLWNNQPARVPAGASGTHFLGSYGNEVRPSIQMVNGQMTYIPDPPYGSAENMQFDSPADAQYFAEHYKEVAPMMRTTNKKQQGGMIPKAQDGSVIYVSDKNDPKLKAYNDSSALYNNYQSVRRSLENANYNQLNIGTPETNKAGFKTLAEKAIKYPKLFETRQESPTMYSVLDLVPWIVNDRLGRQLISPTIQPEGVQRYTKMKMPLNTVRVWEGQGGQGSGGGNSRYSDQGNYVRGDLIHKNWFSKMFNTDTLGDMRVIANYSNVQPKQTVIYQPKQPAIPAKKNSSSTVPRMPAVPEYIPPRMPYNPELDMAIAKHTDIGGYTNYIPAAPEGDYRVQYHDPASGMETHRMFPNEQQGTRFQNVLRDDGLRGPTQGSWNKKQQGGVVQRAQNSRVVTPIVTNDPKDPRLKSYQDSLNLYKAYLMQDRLMGPGKGPVYPMEKGDWTPQQLLQERKKIHPYTDTEGNVTMLANDFQNEADMFEGGFNPWSSRPQDKKLIDYYRKLGFTDRDIMFHSSPDLVHKTIRPLRNYYDGTANSPVYPKPKQPYIYQPGMQRLAYSPETLPYAGSIQGAGISPYINNIPQSTVGDYRVEYRNEQNQPVHRMFGTEQEGSKFQNAIGGERRGYWDRKQQGGVVPKAQNSYFSGMPGPRQTASDNTRVAYTPLQQQAWDINNADTLATQAVATNEYNSRQKVLKKKQQHAIQKRINDSNLYNEPAYNAAGDKMRFFPDDPNSTFDTYFNPLKMVGDMSDQLAHTYADPNSTMAERALAVGTPLAAGLLERIPGMLNKKGPYIPKTKMSNKGISELGMYEQQGGKELYQLANPAEEMSWNATQQMSDDEFTQYLSTLTRAQRNELYGLDPGHSGNYTSPLKAPAGRTDLLYKLIEIDNKQEAAEALQALTKRANRFKENASAENPKNYQNVKDAYKERNMKEFLGLKDKGEGTGSKIADALFGDISVYDLEVINLLDDYNPSSRVSHYGHERLNNYLKSIQRDSEAYKVIHGLADHPAPDVNLAYLPQQKAINYPTDGGKRLLNTQFIKKSKWEDFGREMKNSIKSKGFDPTNEAHVEAFRSAHLKEMQDRAMKDLTNYDRRLFKGISQQKHGGMVSKMGYRDDSPFRNRKSIDIHSPNGLIDMSHTGIDLMANGRRLPAYSGMHKFNSKVITETPADEWELVSETPADEWELIS